MELAYCNYCKTNTHQVDETTGARCQKCLNQNPFANCSPKEYGEYLKDLCITHGINDHEGLIKYYNDNKKRIGQFIADVEKQMDDAVAKKETEKLQQKKNALARVDAAYYDINSPHYRDNERYSWAVKSINQSYEEK